LLDTNPIWECIVTQFASTLYPQTNPTNPILLEFRNYIRSNPAVTSGHLASTWVVRDLFFFEVRGVTFANRDHAIRVLTRLAKFTG